MSLAWRRAGQDDVAAIRAFIEPRESYATGFSSRVMDDSGGLVRIHRGSGGIFMLAGDEGTEAAVLLAPSGTAFPVLSGRLDADGLAVAELSWLYGSKAASEYRPSACIGAASHVAALVAALNWAPELRLEYVSMSVAPGDFASGQGTVESSISFRRAVPGDIDDLLPIAEAYERSEVLTHLHVFDPDACQAAQARSLERQLVYVAESDGRLVARAQTNARGWSSDQIGGVFVVPDKRRQGLGRGVVGALVSAIVGGGRSASLFVKKNNAAARFLYESMGFTVTNDFTVAYFR